MSRRFDWTDEIESFSRIFLAKMGDYVDKWTREIAERDGKIVDRIDEKIDELKESILVRSAMLENMEREIDAVDEIYRKKMTEFRNLIEKAATLKVPANKYLLEKDNLSKLKQGTAAFREQERRIKKFKEKYDAWVEVTRSAEEALRDAQEATAERLRLKRKSKNLSYKGEKFNSGTLANERRYNLEQLVKDKQLLENAFAKNMKENRARLVGAFRDERYVRALSGITVNVINKKLNAALKTGEFSEDEISQLLEGIFDLMMAGRMERFNPLKELAKSRKNYSTYDIGDQEVKIFDMDKISTGDVMRIFLGWVSMDMFECVLLSFNKLKAKRRLFVPEQQKSNDEDGDEQRSLYDTVPENNFVPNDVGCRQTQTGITDYRLMKDSEAQSYWRGLEEFLNRNLNTIAETVNDSLQKQLPEKSYYRKIGGAKALSELRSVLRKVLSACSAELRNGNTAFNKLRNFVKMGLGGVDNAEVFNIIYTEIRAVLEYFVAIKMMHNIQQDIKGLDHNEITRELALLQMLDRKRDQAKKALQDYRTVKYASRSRRIARNIIEQKEFEDPEEMLERIIAASEQLERRIDFLLDSLPAADGSGKHNELVDTRPLRNTGDYGA